VRLGGVPLEEIATDTAAPAGRVRPAGPVPARCEPRRQRPVRGPVADDARIARAFAELDLTDWLDDLPEGIATRAGERGARLSAGERQLVALVRAWLVRPDLLVLDEATSAVDPELDVRLRRAVEQLTDGRTSLTVAHRLATAVAADRVLVFADGRIVEDGAHAALLARGGTYSRLHARWSVDATVD
jgi:ATP-binding cassette, subfamily B, bacterial